MKTCGGATKLERKTVEKNRRLYMKSLCFKLSSLIPKDQYTISKDTLTQEDQFDQATAYIKKLRERVERLKKRKEMALSSQRLDNTTGRVMNSFMLPVIEVRHLDSSLEVFIVSGLTPRSRCNCFNGNCDDSSDDEFDVHASDAPAASGDAAEILKGLVLCASVAERNLLADASKIVEKNKNCRNKDDCRRIVTDGLQFLGYDASICKSRWEKTPSFPSGEYEYLDVIIAGGERLLVDVDFRSEFEIARSTKHYRAILQSLPLVFVGKPDRLQQIIAVVSEAARQSLKKKGLSFPPWRKPEYMKAKWLSPYQRTIAAVKAQQEEGTDDGKAKVESASKVPCSISAVNFSGEFELRFEESSRSQAANSGVSTEEKITVVVSPWQPPEMKPKAGNPGTKVVTGLASVL